MGSKTRYAIKFIGIAVRDLERIDIPFQKIIKEKLLILASNPAALANNITKMTNSKYYRLRLGSYRVIFEKRENELIILIVRIGHRSQDYDR